MSTRTYEGLFLVDPAQAASGWDKVMAHVRELLTKEGATILKESKWAERPLAYPINDQKRGTYILIYFEAPPLSISKIKTACRLSETILREMILVPPKKTMDKLLNPKTESKQQLDKTVQEKQT
ncbi:MAG: 30S ribosomal protein S6 [Planctomycetota bacterium]